MAQQRQKIGQTIRYVLILSCLSLWVVQCSGGNILLVTANALASPSHYMFLSTITGGLVSNGHNVTIVTSDIKGITGFPNGSFSQFLTFKASYSKSDVDELEETMKKAAFTDLGWRKMFQMFSFFMETMFTSCLDLWNDKTVLELLNTSHFDLTLVFPLSSCDVLMAHYVNTPFAVVFPSIRAPIFHEGFVGMPYPSAYVPFDALSVLSDEMTFIERLQNLVSPLFYDIFQYIWNRQFQQIQVEHNISPDKSIKELYSNASLFLAHVSLGSDFPRPYTPHYIPIGGLVSRKSKPLPNEIAQFVEGSGEHGIIIFTLGSAITGLSNKDTAEVFARVFRKLPQRILWRHNAEPPASIGDNTMLLKWLPQNDLLAHSKTRLLIYHGGSNGVHEAIHHGVPMVIIPLLAEQITHAARVQNKGMGLMLKKTNITEQTLMAVVQEVLLNPSYKARAKHFSDIHHDMPMTPLQRAVYWIEHVMKFGGDHLRPRSADMGIIELYMIDVTLFLCSIASVIIYIDYVILVKCYRCVCQGSSSSKVKSE